MDTTNKPSWQQSTEALIFLCALFALAISWGWIISWPLAVAGNEGAIQNLLICFGMSACAISFLFAGYKRPKLLFVGAIVWALTFYLSSFFLGAMISGHNAGTAIRVGAISVLSFVLSGVYLVRKTQ